MLQTDKVYWTMQNGLQIDVDKMSETHLRNVLKMILKAKTVKVAKKKPEIILQGDMSNEFNGAYWDMKEKAELWDACYGVSEI